MANKQDVSIAVLYGMQWSDFRPYAVSLVRSGFKGVRTIFANSITDETRTNFEAMGFLVFDIDIPAPAEHLAGLQQAGNAFAHNFGTQRPLVPMQFLEKSDFRYVIWTGARDVFFQSNPIPWMEKNLIGDKELALAGLRHTSVGCPYNDGWIRNAAQDDDLWREVRQQEALCTDIMVGTSDAMHDLLRDIYYGCQYYPAVDQGMMNCLARTSPYKEITLVPGIDETIAVQWWPERRINACTPPNHLTILNSPENDPIFDESKGEVRNVHGELYSMVHLYDRSPKWGKIIKEKYGN